MIADVHGDQLLVLLTTHYPGWQVEIDGAPSRCSMSAATWQWHAAARRAQGHLYLPAALILYRPGDHPAAVDQLIRFMLRKDCGSSGKPA